MPNFDTPKKGCRVKCQLLHASIIVPHYLEKLPYQKQKLMGRYLWKLDPSTVYLICMVDYHFQKLFLGGQEKQKIYDESKNKYTVECKIAFALIHALYYYCMINRIFFIKQNVTEKCPMFSVKIPLWGFIPIWGGEYRFFSIGIVFPSFLSSL